MLRELQTLYNDPKMLQYAPGGLLPKMGAGRFGKKGQGMKNLSIDDLMSEIWAAGRNCDREKYDDATEELSRRFAALQDGLMKKHEKPKISELCIVERGLVRHNVVCV